MLGPGFSYTYTISTDFPLGEVNIGLLEDEIKSSAIKTDLRGTSVKGDICHVIFTAELDAADKILLDGNVSPPSGSSIIGSHDGDPTPSEEMWFIESDKEYKTNSANYVPTLELSVTNIPQGTYYFHWGFTLGASKYNNDIKFRILLDGTTTLLEKEFSPALSLRGGKWEGALLDHSYFIKKTLLEGNHVVSIQLASAHKSQTAILTNARIELTQVQ